MTPEIKAKLQNASERHEEIAFLLSDPDVMSDQNKFRDLSKEYSGLEELVKTFNSYMESENDLEEANEMLADPEMKELAVETINEAKESMTDLEKKLQILLIPKDPDDDKNIFLEIRAGTGGDEAAIFSGLNPLPTAKIHATCGPPRHLGM